MNFFTRFFAVFFVLSLVWIALVYFQTGNQTKTSQWVNDAYEKKIKIANRIQKKKVIIVAGSNAMFGIDSRKISSFFKLPVVNFGVNAGLYLPYNLYKAKQVIKKGDILLMPLEYPMYGYDGVPNEQMIDSILSRDRALFFQLSFKEQFSILWNVTLNRIYRGYQKKGGQEVRVGLFGVHHLDNNGDQIRTDVKYQSKWMRGRIYNHFANTPETYGKDFQENSLGMQYIEEFVNWCEKRDVKIIFMPSTLMKHNSYVTDLKEKWFYHNIQNIIKNKGWNYIGNPYDYMYDKQYYFDSNFHLVKKGRELRTTQMIEDLKKSSIVKSLQP